MKMIGITGSTGSLGKELTKSKDYKFSKYKSDIRSNKKLQEWFVNNNFDTIIHLAAIVPIKKVNQNKKKALDVNYYGTKKIVDLAIKYKIKWFFYSSTSHVYSSKNKKISEKDKVKPISYYGSTKILSENYIIKKFKNTKVKYCIGRIFSTTNKNQKNNYLVPDLKKKISKKKNIVLKNLNHFRDFISLKDLSAIIFKLHKIKYNGIVNIGTGNSIHLKDLAKFISKKYKKKIKFQDNIKPTFLICDNNKVKRICKIKKFENVYKNIF